MYTLILLTALSCGSTQLEDGTLLYLSHSNAVVETVTQSEISHVALVVNVDGVPYVYEATPAEVRRLSLQRYMRELGSANGRRMVDIEMHAMQPRSPLTDAHRESMKTYLDEQLSRRYSIKSYLRGKSGKGIHCAELTATALQRAAVARFADAQSLSPQQVVSGVASAYQAATEVEIATVTAEGTWCQRSWTRCAAMQRWWRWACVEAWTLCW